MRDQKYVKDVHGHIYVFVPLYHQERIGKGLEFTEPPQAKPTVKPARAPRTLQELREVATRAGFDILDGTPFAKAQNQFAAFMRQPVDSESVDLAGIGAFDNAGKALN
jgi:hypothetical protein